MRNYIIHFFILWCCSLNAIEPVKDIRHKYYTFCDRVGDRDFMHIDTVRKGFTTGIEKGASHMLVWSSNQPPYDGMKISYAYPHENFNDVLNAILKSGYFHEIYSLNLDLDPQLREECAWHIENPPTPFPLQSDANTITIKVLQHPLNMMNFEVPLDTDVYALRVLIEEKTGVKPHNQWLVIDYHYTLTSLYNDTLRANHVHHGMLIALVPVKYDVFDFSDD